MAGIKREQQQQQQQLDKGLGRRDQGPGTMGNVEQMTYCHWQTNVARAAKTERKTDTSTLPSPIFIDRYIYIHLHMFIVI